MGIGLHVLVDLGNPIVKVTDELSREGLGHLLAQLLQLLTETALRKSETKEGREGGDLELLSRVGQDGKTSHSHRTSREDSRHIPCR